MAAEIAHDNWIKSESTMCRLDGRREEEAEKKVAAAPG